MVVVSVVSVLVTPSWVVPVPSRFVVLVTTTGAPPFVETLQTRVPETDQSTVRR
jgi:hypothetical protein